MNGLNIRGVIPNKDINAGVAPHADVFAACERVKAESLAFVEGRAHIDRMKAAAIAAIRDPADLINESEIEHICQRMLATAGSDVRLRQHAEDAAAELNTEVLAERLLQRVEDRAMRTY